MVFVCYSLSCVWLFVTPQTAAQQAPLSMGFSRPRILEWVAVPFSRGSSLPRNGSHICIAGRLFTIWVTMLWQCRRSQFDPWVRKMPWTTHYSILAWRIPWTEEPVGLQSMGSQRVGHDWATNTLTHSRGKEKLSGDWGKKTSILTDTGPTQLSASSWAGRGSKMAQEGGLILHYCHFFSQWEVTYFY